MTEPWWAEKKETKKFRSQRYRKKCRRKLWKMEQNCFRKRRQSLVRSCKEPEGACQVRYWLKFNRWNKIVVDLGEGKSMLHGVLRAEARLCQEDTGRDGSPPWIPRKLDLACLTFLAVVLFTTSPPSPPPPTIVTPQQILLWKYILALAHSLALFFPPMLAPSHLLLLLVFSSPAELLDYL